METSMLLPRLIGALLLLAPSYFIVVPWLTRNWPTAEARVVEVVRENPDGLDGLFARYRKYQRGKDYGIEYKVRGQHYRKNPNIEAIFKSDGFAAKAISIIHEKFDVRYHPHNPNRYSIAHAYKPWAVWTITLFCLFAGAVTIWSSIQGIQ